MHRALSVLVVGAGAVGQAYAKHLQLGGAKVTFFVRERYREASLAGFDLVQLERGRRRVSRLDGCDVVATAAEVAQRTFDQVYLTIPSTGLEGPWLGEFLAATADATIVSLTPTHGDHARIVSQGASEDRVVDGLISLISYHGPLPGEPAGTPEGMTYWFPPGGPCLLSGPAERTEDVVQALLRGGLPAATHPNITQMASFPNAAFMAHLAALEIAGWSFSDFARGDAIVRGARAASEALAVVERSSGRAPFALRLVVTWAPLLRLLLWCMVRVAPLPLEVYVRAHFTKVGAQTRGIVDDLIERGRTEKLAVEALVALRKDLG